MGILGSLLGAGASMIPGIGPIAGPLVGAAFSQVGNKKASGQRQAGADRALQATNPISVFGPTGQAVYDQQKREYTLGMSPEYQEYFDQSNQLGQGALTRYGNFNQGDAAGTVYDRLQQARAPSIASARQSLQAQLLKRGRLGLGVGDGLGNSMFNPEMAAQEEAILRAQLGDYDYAQGESRDQGNYLFDQASGLFNLGNSFTQGTGNLAALGINARVPAGIANLQANAANADANTTQGFFSGLGQQLQSGIENTDFGGFFSGPDLSGNPGGVTGDLLQYSRGDF